MKPTLGGSTFIWNGIKQDYNFIETLDCLYELCDQIAFVYGGDDGTKEAIDEWWLKKMPLSDAKEMHAATISEEEWASQVGREKLSFFSNLAIEMLTTDFNFYLQADEILHQDSFPYVRSAIETGHEAFWCQRLNLWKDSGYMLNVPQERKPCSTEVIRLAKKNYRCIGDAESLGVNREDCYVMGDMQNIQIYHVGFIRDPVKHLEKIRHMQIEVFQFADYDEKAKNCDRLIPERWFSDADLVPIPRPLPKFIQKWCEERYPA